MRSRVAAASAVLLAAGCTGLVGANSQPVAAPPPAPPTISQEVLGQTPWPVKTRYVLDLWLHGYAMLQTDTTQVPSFRRDYRDAMVVAKNSRNILTQLDENAEALKRGLRVNPRLLDGQKLALREQSWEEMGNDIAAFLTADSSAADGGKHGGRPSILSTWKRSSQPTAVTAEMMAALGSVYRTEADREWLRMFALSLTDEHSRFYEQYWREQQHTLRPVLASVDSQFSQRYLKLLRGYLHGVDLPTGEILLSLPLDGEGRTITEGQHSIAIGFPASADSSLEAVYEFAHEAIGVVADQAVRESISPADWRAGVALRYMSAAKVRGGAMLLQRAIPDLVTGYERHYLAVARVPVQGTDVESIFVRTFPLKQAMLDAMDRRLDVVLRGS